MRVALPMCVALGVIAGVCPARAQFYPGGEFDPGNALPPPGPTVPLQPGSSISPSQIPDSARLAPPETAPTEAPPLQTSPGQVPQAQTLAPPNSVALRQGTPDERAISLYERPMPDYDPQGIDLPDFLLFPSVALTAKYNDNVYASSQKISDGSFGIAPKLALRSTFTEDQINADLASISDFYVQRDHEDYNDYQADINGKYYLTPTVVMFGQTSAAHLHEARGSPDASISGPEPTQYDDVVAYGGIAQTKLVLTGQADVFFERLKFWGDGARNYDHVVATGRVGYEVVPQLVTFVRGSYDQRSYYATIDGFDKNSNGYSTVIGADLDINGVIFAEIYGGVMSQYFADPRFSSIVSPDYGVDGVWNPTDRISLLLKVQRSIDESVTSVSPTQLVSATVDTNLTVGAQYQFTGNLLGRADYFHQVLNFRESNFEDDVDGVTASAKYFISPFVNVSPIASFETRSSNRPGRTFDQAQLLFVVNVAY